MVTEKAVKNALRRVLLSILREIKAPIGPVPCLPVAFHLSVDVGLRQYINARGSQDAHGSVIYHIMPFNSYLPRLLH